MGAILGGGSGLDEDDEEDKQAQERLNKWRPETADDDVKKFATMKKRKTSSKSSDSESGDTGSVSEQTDESGSQSGGGESDKSGSESDRSGDKDGSEKSGKSSKDGDEESSSDGSEDDADKQLKTRDQKRKKKIVVKMEFEPLLSLQEPLAQRVEDPADLFQMKKGRRGKDAKQALESARDSHRIKALQAADWMYDNGDLEQVPLVELALALGEDQDELKYSLVQSGRFLVDEDGIVSKTAFQKITEIMEGDIETLQEVAEKLHADVDEDGIRVAVKESGGELRIRTANDIELIERVDLKGEAALQKDEEKERRQKEREEKRKAKKRKKTGDDDDEEESSDDDDDDGGQAKEADKKALQFRRVQVQRKIEEFLKAYTRGQNLTKINAKGRRYHRRVYVDTAKKSLVVQGASGPKFFPFASMKEVDIETRTTKEGRVETLVICAIEKGGRIVKELNLSFPDQGKANTFVNCVTLFSLALRGAKR